VNLAKNRCGPTTLASALALLACVAGTASAQTDYKIPLNYNWHGMAQAGDALFSSNSFNADSSPNLYRSMADRGLVFDLTDPNSLGTLPIVGNTGLTYGLFNSLGYSNTTWPNAAANGLDTVILANRLLNGNNMELTPGNATNNGPFPAWQPASVVSGLSATAGLVATSPAVVTATTSGSHGFRAGDIVLVGGVNPSIAGNTYTTAHPLNGTFTIVSLDATHFTYADSLGNAAASGQRFANNVPASGLSVSAGTVTVTTNAPHGFAAGQSVTISGVSPVGYNGTYSIVAVPTATTFTYASGTTGSSSAAMQLNNALPISTLTANTTTVTATCTGHGLTSGSSATITGSSILAYNGTYTVSVPNATISSITSTTTVATATTDAAHPYTNGQAVTVTGASNANHNVTAATITVPSANILWLSGDGSTVTATTTANTFVSGQLVAISGATPAAYNGTFAITVVDATHFTYSSAATGTQLGTATATSANVFTYPIASFSGTSTGSMSSFTPNVFAYGLVNQGTMLMKPAAITGFTGFSGYGYALTSLQGNGAGVITAATGNVPHGLSIGQTVTISNVLPASYNGTYTIASVPTTTSVTLTDPGTNGAPTTGTFMGCGTADRTSVDQMTTLTSPVTVDGNSQLGFIYIGSNSGGPLEAIMTFGTGPGATTLTARVLCPDWCGNTADSAIVAGQPVTTQGHLFHPLGAPIYALSGDTATITVDTAMAHGFTVGNTVVISGETASGYNGTYTVATIGTTSLATTATGLVSTGGVATATFATAPAFLVGQSIYVSGANPATLNGIYTVTSVAGNTITFNCPVTATTTTAATCARNFFTVAGPATGTPAGTPVAVNNAVSHPSFRGIQNTDAAQLQTFGTSLTSGCANLRVSEAVVWLPASVAGQQLTKLGFRVSPSGTTTGWTTNTLTGLTANGAFGTGTVSSTSGFIPGQRIYIRNAVPTTFNGDYTIVSVPSTNTFTFATTNSGTATTNGTVERPGVGKGYSIHAATVRTGIPAPSCATATVVTTSPTTHLADLATNNFTAAASAPVVTADDIYGSWYAYTAPATGLIQGIISTCTSNFDTTIAVYTSCAGSPIATNDDTTGCGTGGSRVQFDFVNNQTYYIRVGGKAGTKGTFTLHIDDTASPTNSTPSTAALANAGLGTPGDNAGTVDHGLVDGFTTIPAATDTIGVWYQRIATGSVAHVMEARTCLDGQDITITPLPQVNGITGVRTASAADATVVLPLDTTIAVYAGFPTPTSVPVASNDNGCSVSSRVQWTATPGQLYYVRVGVKTSVTGNNAKFVLHVDDTVSTDLPMPLQFNWNGICHGTTTSGPLVSEQTVPITAAPVIGGTHENRSDLNGYRSIADRGLLFDPNNATANALNYGGTIGYQGMHYQVYDTALQADMVHVGNRNLTGGGTGRPWAPSGTLWPSGGGTSTNENGLLPLWLNNDDQRGDQISSMTGMNAVFGPSTKIGILYHISNVGVSSGTTPYPATFDVTLRFSDGAQTVVTVQGTDWFGGASANPYNQVLPAAPITSGLESQRVLGIYRGVDTTDWGKDAPSGSLKVDEAVISTAQLAANGFDPTIHGTLESITFGNVHSGTIDGATNNFTSAIGIYAATLRDPASFSLNYPPSGVGTVVPNQLNAGGTGKMKVTVSRGSGSPNNITTVVVDASAIGLSPTFALNDSGTGGDVQANDNMWSRNVSFPVNTLPNSFSLPFTVTDAQGRTAMGNIIFSVVAPTGTFTPSASVVAGVTEVHAEFVFGTVGGISSVLLDLSQLGLSPTQALLDNGTGGDTTANDGTWGVNFIPSGTTITGTYLIPYTITDTGANVAMGTISISIIPPPPANDVCSGAIPLSAGVTYFGDNTYATTNDGAVSTCIGNTSKGVWFSFTTGPTDAGAWLVSTCGSVQDTVLTLYNAGATCANADGNQMACNDQSGVACTGNPASLQAPLAASSTYLIRLESWPLTATGGTFNIIVTPYVTGACCNNTTGACTLVASTACVSTTSTYQGDNVACPTTCAVSGACCNNTTGACTFIYGGFCPTGTFGGANSVCDALTCPPSGICCNNNTGACTFFYGVGCTGSTTTGVGVTCSAGTPSSSCTPVGACCDNVTGACTLLYGGLCPANGNFSSDLVCAPTTCPQFQWACCFSDGSCLSMYQNDCGTHAGAVWAPGQTCGVYACPSCTNVLANPGAETGDLSGWTIDLNAAGWQSGTNAGYMHSGNNYFATSFTLSRRHQLIDLTQFMTASQLDAAPDISAGEWVRARTDQSGQYYILVQLLAADQTTVISSFNDGTSTALTQLPAGSPYALVSHTFSAYGPGVRYLWFEDGGRDLAGWSGFYGTHFDDAFAGPTQTTAACCSPTTGCSVISNADCLTAGGIPQACGTSCAPSPCPGVCCRGSTCSTAFTSPAACGAATTTSSTSGPGWAFASSTSVCNSGVNPDGTYSGGLTSTRTPCCFANYNHNATLEVQDIFDFLNDWFAGRAIAIPGGDGTSTTGLAVQNIFNFLNAWFAGGCL
jgi:hypothetical protein